MGLSVVPHVVEPTKRSVPAVETAVGISMGECLVRSMPNAGTRGEYGSSLVKAGRCVVGTATARPERTPDAGSLLNADTGQVLLGPEYVAGTKGLHSLKKGARR